MFDYTFMSILILVMLAFLMISIVFCLCITRHMKAHLDELRYWKDANDAGYRTLLNTINREHNLIQYLYSLLFDLITETDEATVQMKVEHLHAILICLHIGDPDDIKQIMEDLHYCHDTNTIVATLRDLLTNYTDGMEYTSEISMVEYFNNFLSEYKKYMEYEKSEYDTMMKTTDQLKEYKHRQLISDDHITMLLSNVRAMSTINFETELELIDIPDKEESVN